MAPATPRSNGSPSRRSLLSATATGLTVAASGCVRQTRNVLGRNPTDQLSMTIATVPSDYDTELVQLASLLGDALEAVGIDVSIEYLAQVEFLRTVLVNHDFDLYVGRHPGDVDPDFLYELLHSRYADESGWQNPFGFTSMAFDERLEAQRDLDGDQRREEVAEILTGVANEQPFVPICMPIERRIVRTDRFEGWGDDHPTTRLGYLGLDPLANDDSFAGAITDTRPTINLNPLSVEYRGEGPLVSLVYDSLGTAVDDEVRPWLASEWEWDGSTATVTLRDDCRWHDGEVLTADDVAFTYRFLEDTSLGESEAPSPPPLYRGRAAAVSSVAVDPEDTLTLTIDVDATPAVGERAFTVPILPEHVWTDRTNDADVAGFGTTPGTTEAVVTDNVPPIGSGPFQFVERTERESLVLEQFDDHFSRRSMTLPAATAETVRIVVHPRSASAIEAVKDGDVDVTITPLAPGLAGGVNESAPIRLLESPSRAFYHVGFNARNAPCSNPYFRRTVARLLDKAWIVEEVFEGQAIPVGTPMTGEWVPEKLAWDGTDPAVPFLGTDGEFNETVARTAFEEAGFEYDDEGRLLARH
ncbi:ABC transporter substrate-binding protein [Natrialbaceae archaeon AArc-T1-2]|uniref:ABC transporter substrate-binding protein n=1 Tax=Natrialbaceae archaeon AArc-T1-2 TaxID=3053904 RepID=UPI00255ABA88|nr:ABC transporter substrate-binding protein [Natrialbaceae archaeon AArc-T1-2]WIV67042.1 ABC transporter substrate-binding protein [Natrialbaceae archaeon AArc-T1-2]